MSFSFEWEERYAERAHWSVWPWSDVVSLVHRHCQEAIRRGTPRVFEFGCGPGANIQFFKALGCDYFSVEGSHSAVAAVHDVHPDLKDRVIVGDFTQPHGFGGSFDLVIDRASITHNAVPAIEHFLAIASDCLKPGGVFIGSDWFSTEHSDFQKGTDAGDPFTRTQIPDGQFSGVGKVHFSDEAHLRDLFCRYDLLYLEEKFLRRKEPEGAQFASWNIVARKPA